MSEALFALMRNHWGATGLFALLVIVSGVAVWQSHSIARMEQKLVLCSAEGQALAVSNASLLASLREQNKAVAGLQEASRVKSAAAAKALKARQKESGKYAVLAQRIMQMPLPGQDECAQLKALLRDGLMP